MSEAIVFFGSGPVAAESLRLLAQTFTIEAVVTKPRPPHHRGSVPVVEAANELNVPLLTARNKAELDALFDSQPVHSKLAILIDFGIIVSQKIIDYFPLGIINSHFSLLPKLRGADPISFAVLNGEGLTGVSLMMLVEAMDEGPVLAYGQFVMPDDITTPVLTDNLIELSDHLLKQIVPEYVAGKVQASPQAETGATYSRKLSKADGVLDWQKPVANLEREVRAFAGWPRSRTKLATTDIVITKAHVLAEPTDGAPGTLWIGERSIGMHAKDGVLVFDKLIPAGKKEMTAEAFLAGYKIG